MNYSELVTVAQNVKKNAYAPFSEFQVGAALITTEGEIFTGVNIENSTYGATNCAERTAIFKAISEKGKIEIQAIAIASSLDDFLYPCGICRQVIYEFSNKETKVICSKNTGEYRVHTIEELLPYAFKFQK